MNNNAKIHPEAK